MAEVAEVAEVAAAVVAAAAVDDEDGVQWRRWGGGRSMAVAAFDSSIDELRIGDVKAKMAIDTIGGEWQQRA